MFRGALGTCLSLLILVNSFLVEFFLNRQQPPLLLLMCSSCADCHNSCIIAAMKGHLDCLQSAHANGCPWNEDTCSFAAQNGHFDCLQYAYENGCPWNEGTCLFAAQHGHLDCLQYAHANRCPYPPKLLPTIVQKILYPKWRWLVRVRPYALHWLEEHAKTQCAAGGAARKRDRAAFEQLNC